MFTFFVVSSLIWRAAAPTQPDWMLYPISQENLVCHNQLFWLMGRCYGRREMYEALLQTARHVRREYPEVTLAYMEVNGRTPGRLWPHISHRQGLDVDIQFVGRTRDKEFFPSGSSLMNFGYNIDYDEKGRCGPLRFDVGANWMVVDGLYRSAPDRVANIFVEPYIRIWLLKEARRRKVSSKELDWAARHLNYAGKNAARHDDHFHVRFVGDDQTSKTAHPARNATAVSKR